MTRNGIRGRAVVCCSPLPEKWTWFVDKLTAPDVDWMYFSTQTPSPWERWLKKPALRNPVTAYRAVAAARRTGAPVIFSMGPQLAFWVAAWSNLFGFRNRHLAFWFNFPEIPGKFKCWLLSLPYKQLETIRIQAKMEIPLYHELFDIPLETMTFKYWTMKTPEIEPAEPLMPGDYLSAVGGNARDYATLAEACRLAPEIPMVWVVRPENIAGLTIPPQVKIAQQVPYPHAMNYLYYSKATVVPLRDSAVPCGHVTLTSAMFLSKAILITDSEGIKDYVFDEVNGLFCKPKDPVDMARQMRRLIQDRALAERLGHAGLRFAEENCTDEHVEQEMREFLGKSGLTAPPQNYGVAG